jgi:L,D-peptidoglycan transpeptidase YkuD (ErfK/YbiS/YcfS/YnhG family)
LKKRTRKSKILLLGLFLFYFACKTRPPPSEAAEAEALEQALWRAGASVFAQEEYDLYREGLKTVKAKLAREKAKFGWFRNYGPIQSEYQDLLKTGTDVLKAIENKKAAKSKALEERSDSLKSRVERLKNMTLFFNESGAVRKNLSQAEIKLVQADLLLGKEQFESAGDILESGSRYLGQAEQAIASLLDRYLDKSQLEKWKTWADESIAESQRRGVVVILVNKLERKLILYKKGRIVGSYDIGLGRFGLSDKLFSGDEATPEGRYQVIKKIPGGPFYKALLINYPNEEDKKAFALAKKNGHVPSQVGIGGSIEIHGGGKDSLTKGCVGLEDHDMDAVYRLAEVGTLVTIVGALSVENSILAEIKAFEKK